MKRIQLIFKQGLGFWRLVLIIMIVVAGHIDHWKYDFSRVWFALSSSRLFLYLAFAAVIALITAVILDYFRRGNLKRWSWVLWGAILLVLAEDFARGAIHYYSEVSTSRLAMGLGLAGFSIFTVAMVAEYRREQQKKRAGESSPAQLSLKAGKS